MRLIPLEANQVWTATQNIWGDGVDAHAPLIIESVSPEAIKYSRATMTFVASPKEFRRWIREKSATVTQGATP